MHKPNDFEKIHEKQRKTMPKNWARMLSQFPPASMTVSDLEKLFGVSHSTLNRWRKADENFGEAVILKMKNAHCSRRKNEEPETPKEIDIERVFVDLRMLHLSTTNKHDKSVLALALEAISILRVELRHAKSEAQIARERLHFRASGRASRPHATNGNGADTGAPP